jgi:hypothetical protein
MLLLKAGDRGATLGELLKELDDNYSPDVVRRGLAKLVRDGLVKKVGDMYVTTAALRSRPVAAKAQERMVTIEVEKVYPGFAVVLVDDRSLLDGPSISISIGLWSQEPSRLFSSGIPCPLRLLPSPLGEQRSRLWVPRAPPLPSGCACTQRACTCNGDMCSSRFRRH